MAKLDSDTRLKADARMHAKAGNPPSFNPHQLGSKASAEWAAEFLNTVLAMPHDNLCNCYACRAGRMIP